MNGKKILIIDDDADYLEANKVILTAEGYDVSTADSVEEGEKELARVSPALIIVDVMMEKMSDGFDLARKLKNDDKYRGIPLLMITAIGDETGFKFSAEAGDEEWLPVNGYLEKPVGAEKLIAKIEKLLSRS